MNLRPLPPEDASPSCNALQLPVNARRSVVNGGNEAGTEQVFGSERSADPCSSVDPTANAAWLHILQHSLGADQYGQGDRYRSHFVTGEGSADYPVCMALFEAGLMTRRDGKNLPFGGMDIFHATDAGRAYVTSHSPTPPKLTPGQRRYRRYLAADSSLSFGEWLQSPWAGESA